MAIITFDYDQTLDQPRFQELAKWLTSETKHDVFILTSRSNSLVQKQYKNYDKQLLNNAEVFKVAKSVGIEPQNVIFTNGESKRSIIIRSGVSVHIDDNKYELEGLREITKTFNSKEIDSEFSAKEYIKQLK